MCGVDQIEPTAFDNLQRHRRRSVKARSACAVLKRQADFCKIAQRDNAVAVDLDGQGVNVAWFIETGGDFDSERPLCRLYFTGGDQ